ncbi:transposase [Prevotella histicola]
MFFPKRKYRLFFFNLQGIAQKNFIFNTQKDDEDNKKEVFITKLKSNMKGALMSVSDRLLLRKRAIIETVNDELKNIAQVEHSRHRCFDKFIVNLLGAIAAYCLFPKKPCINVQRTIDTQLALF